MASFSNSAWIEEERPESAEQSVAWRQVGCPSATTAQHNQLLLEHQILGDHRSDAAGATELGGRDGQVQQDEQQVPHARVSVGQTSRAVQRCAILDSAREFAIRDRQVPRSLDSDWRAAFPTGDQQYVAHYHRERNHQGIANQLIEGAPAASMRGPIRRRPHLGGLLNYYERAA